MLIKAKDVFKIGKYFVPHGFLQKENNILNKYNYQMRVTFLQILQIKCQKNIFKIIWENILILLEHIEKQVNFHVREVAVFEIFSQLWISYKTIICCSHLESIFNIQLPVLKKTRLKAIQLIFAIELMGMGPII